MPGSTVGRSISASFKHNSEFSHRSQRRPRSKSTVILSHFFLYLDYGRGSLAQGIKTSWKNFGEVSVEMRTLMTSFCFGATCAAVLLTAMGNSNLANAQSATVCDSYARNYAQNASRQGQVIGRGALGSLLGAGIGAAFGGAAIGAAVGGGFGLIGGGSKRQKTANRMYNAAFQDCMAGRVR